MNDTQENKSFTRNAPDGMGYVKNETRTHIACTKLALLTLAGIRTAEYCGQTAKDRMVNIKLGKSLSFGVDGRKTAEYSAQHTRGEMVSISSKNKYRTKGCGKQLSFGVAGTNKRE